MKPLTAIMAGLLALAVLAGCGATEQQRAYEYMPDMARDPAYKAFAPNPVTRDGLTLQRPVAGTIPRGYQPFYYGAGDPEAVRAGVDGVSSGAVFLRDYSGNRQDAFLCRATDCG